MFKIVTCLAAAALVLVTAPAEAQSPGDACPPPKSGFVLWDVDTEPYEADNYFDEVLGNGDGWVCARPTYVVLDENDEPFQIYNFIDNMVVAR